MRYISVERHCSEVDEAPIAGTGHGGCVRDAVGEAAGCGGVGY